MKSRSVDPGLGRIPWGSAPISLLLSQPGFPRRLAVAVAKQSGLRNASYQASVGGPSAIIVITVAQLLVRDIESDVVRELKLRAAQHGRSAEEEHRQILREALRSRGPAKPLKELLLEMPDVGEGGDFERPEDRGRPVEL